MRSLQEVEEAGTMLAPQGYVSYAPLSSVERFGPRDEEPVPKTR